MKERRPFKTLFHSLYFRLLLVFGLTFFLMLIALRLVHMGFVGKPPHEIFQKNMAAYGEYLLRDVGYPVDVDRAEGFAREYGVAFVERDSGKVYGDAVLEDEHREKIFAMEGLHHRHKLFLYRPAGGPVAVIFGAKLTAPNPLIFPVAAMAIFVVLLLSYWVVRRIFRPIKSLERTAREFGSGNWRVRAQVCGRSELGQLASTMNLMADRIERHISRMKELLLGVSHEIRSPLTRMRVALEFVTDEKVKKSVNDEIEYLDKLTGSLLQRERIEAGQIETAECDLKDLLIEVIGSFGDREPGIEFRGEPIRLRIDADYIALCLRNLLDNAFTHGKPEKPIVLHLHRKQGAVVVEVENQGDPIPEEQLDSVQTLFFRVDSARGTDRESGGFGVGLSLCASIMRAHGGELVIENTASGVRAQMRFPNPSSG